MISLTNPIQESINTGEVLSLMAESYAELAANRLNQIRFKIERNRQFAEDLAKTFHEVKVAASHYKMPNRQKKPWLNVILFSNYGFFLNIETQLVQLFLKSDQANSDLLIIGRTGVEIAKSLLPDKPYDILIFSHDLPTPGEVGNAADKMVNYERVAVYYSQFRTLAAQSATFVDISGDVGAFGQAGSDNPQSDAILEPEAPKLLEFFEGQIMRLLLEQTFLEAELARTSARLLMMDAAHNKAKDFVKAQMNLLKQEQKRHFNITVLEMSLGLLARRKHEEF